MIFVRMSWHHSRFFQIFTERLSVFIGHLGGGAAVIGIKSILQKSSLGYGKIKDLGEMVKYLL